jgi:hypothetical protein
MVAVSTFMEWSTVALPNLVLQHLAYSFMAITKKSLTPGTSSTVDITAFM